MFVTTSARSVASVLSSRLVALPARTRVEPFGRAVEHRRRLRRTVRRSDDDDGRSRGAGALRDAGTAARGAARARAREARGQGTVEYVGLILLVAVILAGVVKASGGLKDSTIAEAVIKKLKGAIDSVGEGK